MHGQIATVADHVVGVDIDEDGVNQTAERGYDVRLGNAETFDLQEQFDIVFAGELIEHLSNFGAFVQNAKRHLAPHGKLIITTPNAFCFSNFVYRFGFRAQVHHEHTCWFCEDTLCQLLARYDLSVVETKYLPHTTPGTLRKLAAAFVHAILPDKLAWRTVMVVAEHDTTS